MEDIIKSDRKEKSMGECGLDLFGSEQAPVVGSYEHLEFHKNCGFPDEQSNLSSPIDCSV
jgi:hypothetical protein